VAEEATAQIRSNQMKGVIDVNLLGVTRRRVTMCAVGLLLAVAGLAAVQVQSASADMCMADCWTDDGGWSGGGGLGGGDGGGDANDGVGGGNGDGPVGGVPDNSPSGTGWGDDRLANDEDAGTGGSGDAGTGGSGDADVQPEGITFGDDEVEPIVVDGPPRDQEYYDACMVRREWFCDAAGVISAAQGGPIYGYGVKQVCRMAYQWACEKGADETDEP
jgi:hypothetical protein